MKQEFLQSLGAARQYLELGLVPLPSRMDLKAPTIEYARYRKETPDSWIYQEGVWQTTNIQLMTGVNTPGSLKILVVDLDGELAKKQWRAQCDAHGYNPGRSHAWFVRSASGGVHCYYRIQPSILSCPTRRLWGLWDTWGGDNRKGDWVKHSEVRILGDHSLVVAPPSRHVRLSEPYKWVGWHHPGFIPIPEDAPNWLMEMPGLSNMQQPDIKIKETNWQRIESGNWPDNLSHSQKLNLVASWGLKLHGRTSREGVYCYRIDSNEDHPSAIFNTDSGVYHDFVNGESLSLAALAVRLGVFKTRGDAIKATK